MVSIKNALVFAVLALLLVPFASAFAISSITTSASTSRVTTGTDVTITSSVTADSSGTATQISLAGTGATTGSSLTVSDPAPGYYSSVSLSTSATSLAYVMSAATPDTYTYSVTGTYSGGSTSSSDGTIVFVSPDTLSVSGTNSNTSNTVGGSFIVEVSVTNPSSTQSVTTSYALSFTSSKFALLSGDSTSGTVTLEPSQSQTFTYTLNATGAVTGSAITFGLGDNSAVYSTSVTNTAVSTPTPTPTATPTTSVNTGGSSATATPAPAATTAAVAPVLLPPAPSTTDAGQPVESTQTEQITSSSEVRGSFASDSATLEVAYKASASGFNGEITYRMPLDYADYQNGLVKFNPEPTSVQPGSIIATWNVALAPAETFVAKVDVAKKLDAAILKQFTAPKLAPSKSSVATPVPSVAPVATAAKPAPIKPVQTDNTLLYIVGALVILGLLYYFMAMRKK